jgi:SAM-dependent methyltransferase
MLDQTLETPIEPIYFVQDTWFASRLASRRPPAHVDVGSSAKTMAIVSQFVPVTMVDIRPVPIRVPGFSFVEGTVLALPFDDASVASLSSLCVVEHVGLGRYGDPLDPRGSELALLELRRVLAPGGDLYLSVPVDSACRVYFNAHRAFTREYLLECCRGLEVVEEAYLYGRELTGNFQPDRGFGTVLLHLRKS